MAVTGTRLSKIAREFNVGISTIVEFLRKKGYDVDPNPNTKVTEEIHDILIEEYSSDISIKRESDRLSLKNLREKKDTISIHDIDQQRPAKPENEEEVFIKDPTATGKLNLAQEEPDIKVVGKVDLDAVGKGRKKPAEEKEAGEKKPAAEEEAQEEKKQVPSAKSGTGEPATKETGGKVAEPAADTQKEKEEKKPAAKEAASTGKPAAEDDANFIRTKIEKLNGPSVVGKIELPVEDRRESDRESRKKRKRIKKDTERRVDLGEKAERVTQTGARYRKNRV
jgi:translation initiation factor IF-2